MRVCTICSHPKKNEIEKSLIDGVAYRRIASQFKVGDKSVERHAKSCVASKIEKAVEKIELRDAITLLEQVNELRAETMSVLSKVRDSHEVDALQVALSAIGRREKQIELLAKLTGAFQKDKDNESDIERKKHIYERTISRVIESAREQGLEIDRAAALEGLYQYFPDISELCQ